MQFHLRSTLRLAGIVKHISITAIGRLDDVCTIFQRIRRFGLSAAGDVLGIAEILDTQVYRIVSTDALGKYHDDIVLLKVNTRGVFVGIVSGTGFQLLLQSATVHVAAEFAHTELRAVIALKQVVG